MDRLTNWLTALLFSAVIVANLPAQDKLVLTLDGSVELAFKNNPSYQIALKEVDKAKASVVESYSSILPQLSSSAAFQHAWEIQESTIPNFIKLMFPPDFPGIESMPDYVRISFGLENTITLGAQLTQPLFLGGAGIAGIKMAGAASRAAERNLEKARQDLLYNTANAFYTCLIAKEVVKVQEEALQQSQENMDMVRKKYEAGAASKFDLMRAEVNVANTKPSAISARNQAKIALTRLKMILALPMETEIDVDGQLAYEEDEFTTMTTLDYERMALATRPEVQALQEQKRISRQGIALARSSFLPKLFFATDYSYLGMTNELTIGGVDYSRGFTSAVSLQLPLFTGLKNNKQYQKSKIDYRMMLDAEKSVTDGVTAEVEAVYSTFREAKEKYAAAAENAQLAEETFRLATMMYEEGTNTQLDVFTAQVGLTSARLNYLSSLYEYQLTRYALRKVTGNLKEIL
ncbi:TolC family protein [candidate division KSB1 bacterium]|nr:TolC family protein [candidate division KSB1 bacterium]RQW02864.1 MAG: TolC family protein [candidate division KSB1 bacterium]